jgi:hypothetical protein
VGGPRVCAGGNGGGKGGGASARLSVSVCWVPPGDPSHFKTIAKRLISNHPALSDLIETRKPPQTDKFAIIQVVKKAEVKGFRCVSMTFSDGARKFTGSIDTIRRLAGAEKKAS